MEKDLPTPILSYFQNNIILGNGANTDPGDNYMLVIGTWKYQMTPEDYEIIHKAIMEVIKTIYDNKDDDVLIKWVNSLKTYE